VNPPPNPLPRELDKASLPAYVIEPPDLLTIDALRVVPLPPYHVEPLDALFIQVSDVDPNHPIEPGIFQIDPDGTVNLGLFYGKVKVVGLTTDQIAVAIEAHLKKLGFAAPRANVGLYQTRAFQLIRGEHLVRLDGTISLGTYGSVYVTGLTIEEAKKAIETQLSKVLQNPEVSVDILAYNSKVFYVVTDGAGNGETIVRLPITGNETVLDAMSSVGGIAPQGSKKRIWIARPKPPSAGGGDQVLPVDWNAIVQCGKTETNYQIMPYDRIYVKAQPLITFNNMLGHLLDPIERVFGVTLLGQETVLSFQTTRGGLSAATGVGQ
jgi:polysaccharide export outer membrane protein